MDLKKIFLIFRAIKARFQTPTWGASQFPALWLFAEGLIFF